MYLEPLSLGGGSETRTSPTKVPMERKSCRALEERPLRASRGFGRHDTLGVDSALQEANARPSRTVRRWWSQEKFPGTGTQDPRSRQFA